MRLLIPLFLILSLIVSGLGGAELAITNSTFQEGEIGNSDGTEYWALLVGVSENMKKPWNNAKNKEREISTLDVYNQFLLSDNWQPDHIRLLTGKNATWLNIYKGLRWLDEMDDEDDICLFYIATHGAQAPDIYPKDEEDGLDEVLIAYDTDRLYFPKIGLTIHIPPRLFYLYDDDINYMLNLLDAQGICVIIDACYSGGFNDSIVNTNMAPTKNSVVSLSSSNFARLWSQSYAQEIAGQGRIVIALSAEDKLSQSYSFIHYFLEALQGYGDTTTDGSCTAEEAFAYTTPKYITFCAREMNFDATPQIFDDYPEELFLSMCEYPPHPTTFDGPVIGQSDTQYNFTIVANDVEQDTIRYLIDWGDGTEDITDYFPSGESVYLSHQWDSPGTYNIWFESEDEHGAVKWSQTGFPDDIAITITDTQLIDQRQTLFYDECCMNAVMMTHEQWLAQSFLPATSILSQVDLEAMVSAVYTEPCPLLVSIRRNLTDEDLTSVILIPHQIQNHLVPEVTRFMWTTFDFPDIQVIPGNIYYIICRCQNEAVGLWEYAGVGYEHDPDYSDDPYYNGTAFLSPNQGSDWQKLSTVQDFCFVTYGK